MNIGLDIDGCLMDFTNLAWNGMSLFLERHNENYNPVDFPSYSYKEQFNISKELEDSFWLEEESRYMYLDLPPRPYTIEVLDYLKNNGHKLYIITARNNTYANKDLIERTYVWLNKYNIKVDGVYFNTGDKVDTINNLKIDFMLEDSPSNIIKISKKTNCKVFCFDTFCNREIQDDLNIIRVYSMLDFKEKIDREIKNPRKQKNVLLVVDLQKEFKDKNGQYEKILSFIKNNKYKYDEIIATKFIKGNLNFQKYLKYDFPNKTFDLEFNPDKIIEKIGYGIDDYSRLPKYYNYTIVGCETDACILKIAYDMFDKEYNFYILKDYVYTNGKLNEEAFKILERNLKCFK